MKIDAAVFIILSVIPFNKRSFEAKDIKLYDFKLKLHKVLNSLESKPIPNPIKQANIYYIKNDTVHT